MKSLITVTITTIVFALSAHANAATDNRQSNQPEITDSHFVQFLEKVENDVQEQLQTAVEEVMLRESKEVELNHHVITGNSDEYLQLYTVYSNSEGASQSTDAS